MAHTVTDPSGVQAVMLTKATAVPDCHGPAAPFPVYYPHTAVLPEIAEAAPVNATWVNVAASPLSYWAAMASWWERGETFAVVEHDVVARPDVFTSFEDCPEPWCLYGYGNMCHPACQEAWRNQLGCTRFRAEIIAAVPDAVLGMEPHLRDWHNMCDGVGNALRAAGYTHHWHYPAIEHTQRVQREGH